MEVENATNSWRALIDHGFAQGSVESFEDIVHSRESMDAHDDSHHEKYYEDHDQKEVFLHGDFKGEHIFIQETEIVNIIEQCYNNAH